MKKITLLLLFSTLLFSATIEVKSGWNLVGTSTKIDIEKSFSLYPDIEVVWAYKDGWLAYSEEKSVKEFIELDRNRGFWVLNSGETIEIELIEIIENEAIRDSNLLTCINEELEKESSYIPTDIDLQTITTLSCGNRYIKDLRGIGNLLNLEVLRVPNNQIGIFQKELANLTKLTTLSIYGNYLIEVPEEVKRLESLEKLYIKDNFLSATEIDKIKALLPNATISY